MVCHVYHFFEWRLPHATIQRYDYVFALVGNHTFISLPPAAPMLAEDGHFSRSWGGVR